MDTDPGHPRATPVGVLGSRESGRLLGTGTLLFPPPPPDSDARTAPGSWVRLPGANAVRPLFRPGRLGCSAETHAGAEKIDPSVRERRSRRFLLVAQRFPVLGRREITFADPGSSRKSTIRLLLNRVSTLFPCIFPTDLGFPPRDRFAPDYAHRRGVRVSPVRRPGPRAGSRNSRLFPGF
jgi:hypothetical protein